MFFVFNDTATTEIYTLSLHDALPILSALKMNARRAPSKGRLAARRTISLTCPMVVNAPSGTISVRSGCIPLSALSSTATRSEEHTSELQSRQYLVCRLLLEKKKKSYP